MIPARRGASSFDWKKPRRACAQHPDELRHRVELEGRAHLYTGHAAELHRQGAVRVPVRHRLDEGDGLEPVIPWGRLRFPAPVRYPGGERGIFDPGALGELHPAQPAAFKLVEQGLSALGRYAHPARSVAGKAILLGIGKRRSRP